mmetsp:Transcript_24993/g.26817  ORF Transcript_24993/g.26817 Transcript_24993/m.26817 type:complete len:80 (-) Transcript_24993:67-306(-)
MECGAVQRQHHHQWNKIRHVTIRNSLHLSHSIPYCTRCGGGFSWGWEWSACGETTTSLSLFDNITVIKQYPPSHHRCTN